MKQLIVFSAEDQPCICVMSQDSDWLMDSGATHHATLKRDVFVRYHNRDFSEVKMRNKDVSQIVSIGDVHLEAETSWPLVL